MNESQRLTIDAYWSRQRGELESAISLQHAAIDALRESNDIDRRCVLLNTLADILAEKGDLDEAIEIARTIVGIRVKTGDDSILHGNDLMFLAWLLRDRGDYVESAQVADKGVGYYRATMGDNHPETVRMSEFLSQTRKLEAKR